MGLPAIALAMIGGGTALETYSTLQEGKEAAKAGKYAQIMSERNAVAIEQAGLHEQRLLREQGRQIRARQIVNAAAGGGNLTGSNLKAIMRSAAAIEADVATTGQNTQFRASSERYRGAMERYRGRMARYGSRIGAATSIGKSIGSSLLLWTRYRGGAKAPVRISGGTDSISQRLGQTWPGTKWNR